MKRATDVWFRSSDQKYLAVQINVSMTGRLIEPTVQIKMSWASHLLDASGQKLHGHEALWKTSFLSKNMRKTGMKSRESTHPQHIHETACDWAPQQDHVALSLSPWEFFFRR